LVSQAAIIIDPLFERLTRALTRHAQKNLNLPASRRRYPQ
ncbi:hypothetical protein ACQWHW_26810, partial [Salmonella enterica subsp. enterica serovar Infantis]